MSARPSQGQREAADPRFSAWVTANAGSGKTKVLVDRVARLLLAGAEPDRILASTFTKAAAAEMQSRLFERLGGWAVADDARLAGDLNLLEGRDEQAPVPPARLSRARGLFARALETPGGLKVKTIHALCTDILQRFPLEAGLHPGFTVWEDDESARALDRALLAGRRAAPLAAAALAQAMEDGPRIERIKEFLSHRDRLAGPDMDAAAAIDRLYGLLGVSADDTPDGRAASALARLDPQVMAAAVSFIRGARKAGKTDIAAADALAAVQVEADPLKVLEILRPVVMTNARTVRKTPVTGAVRSAPAIVQLFGRADGDTGDIWDVVLDAVEAVRAVETARLSAALIRLGLATHAAYEGEKARLGALDFDDLIQRTTDLLTGADGAARWVLYKLDQGLEHVLVDEAQDTSPRQWDLLKPLIEEMQAGDGAHDRNRTLFVVGDEKQSIFSFQGADPEKFKAEKEAFRAADDERRVLPTLATSYRSTGQVLKLVDAVWDADGREPAAHTAHRADPGYVEWRPITAKPEGKEAQPGADGVLPPVDAMGPTSPKVLLAQAIAADVRRWLDEGRAVMDRGGPRAMRASDVLILVTSRTDGLATQLLRCLQRERVPVAGADRVVLAGELAVMDVLAAMRVALLPEDDLMLATVLKGPFVGRLDDEGELRPLLGGRDRGVTAWDRLRRTDDPLWADAKSLIAVLMGRVSQLPPYEFIAALLDRPLPDGRTGWQALFERLGPEAREPVEVLMARALAYGRTGSASLEGFLAEIDADERSVKREFGSEAPTGVRIMTVHGAKGLEAPVVILPQTTKGVKKSKGKVFFDAGARTFLFSTRKEDDPAVLTDLRTVADEAAAREDARLLYVALTRARDHLIICGHQSGTSKAGRAQGCWHEQVEVALSSLDATPDADGRIRYGVAPVAIGAAAEAGRLAPAIPAWAREAAPADAVPPRSAAPSRLAALEPPPAPSPLLAQGPDRFRRGSLIHALLERLPDAPPERRAALAARRLAAETDLDAAARNDIIAETLAVLAHPDFAPVFGPGSRAEVAISGRGPGLPDGVILDGAIDRLVIGDDAILILDFKTNRPPPERVEDVDPAYAAQLGAYRAVLSALYPDRPVRCALLWTFAPRLMEIPGSMLDAALRGIAPPHT